MDKMDKMDKMDWEYLVIDLVNKMDSGNVYQEKLNELGNEGWELVFIDFSCSRLFLKRIKN